MSRKLWVCIMLVGGVPDTLACPIIGFPQWQHGAHRRVLSVCFSRTHTQTNRYEYMCTCTPGWKRGGSRTASCRAGYTLSRRGTHTYTHTQTHMHAKHEHAQQNLIHRRRCNFYSRQDISHTHTHTQAQQAVMWESSCTHVRGLNENIYSQSHTARPHYTICTHTPMSSTQPYEGDTQAHIPIHLTHGRCTE